MPLIGADRIAAYSAGGTRVEVLDADLAPLAGTGGSSTAGITAASADSITAHANGGQTSAVQLSASFNRVTTVATAADSVKLPVAKAGLSVTVRNAGANTLAIFPYSGDAINAGSANASVSLAAGNEMVFRCATDGTWRSQVGNSPAGGFAVSGRLFHSGGAPAMASTDGNDTTPSATEAYFSEVHVDTNCTLTGVANFNGSVASGNLAVALYDSNGNLLAHSDGAGTAMSGTDTYQRIPFTATYDAVGPATYYIGLQVDNNTARTNTWPVGNFGASKQTGQTFGTFTTLTPPTTFTANQGPMASLY